ncbi:MAG: carboxymuconolactone decarboxylase family protein [Vreelandella alkaliphila]|uniref:carboxymuconolactone decarboxylase family protein n=1 Tax=Halomonadaceae TaxID=28256 RepID=UPI000E937628|nr:MULTISPECIES: carboxymuconolactone decarboxylase family protein [unclassified Halomonas]WKD29366.1 carboxymuconolactone decarboxylase family protein [Halomonas sp. KG2]HBP41046.1 alkylhydroperoxidase [Halomonas sp.]HBS84243.1 alkylhydroperoxidase [Halomonas campaniensis]
MEIRLNAYKASPEGIAAMTKLEEYVRHCGLEFSLAMLVKTRASQINGCAYCLHMHTSDARAAGESEERLYLLSAWRESTLYTPRERAALAWTEALTRLPDTGAPAKDYEQGLESFTEKELVDLTLLIGAINVWNRISVGFRSVHPNEAKIAR